MVNNKLFKLSSLAIITSIAFNTQASFNHSDEKGSLSIYGDIEIDTNYLNEKFANPNIKDKSTYDQNGRVLIGISGDRKINSNGYIKFLGVSLLDLDGDVDSDDAWLAFGEYNDWEMKLGRFESYNLFPVGQDTYLVHAQDIYTASYARGRSNKGQVNIAKYMDKAYFEITANFMENNGAKDNAVFLRPTIAYSFTDSLKLAAGAEINATSDKSDPDNDFIGYGATLNYQSDNLSAALNYAYRDFDTKTREDTTYGGYVLYKDFQIGYISGSTDTNIKSDVDSIYTSYKFANVMDIEDFAIYLGAFSSEVDGNDESDQGARIRLKYLF